jgi:hypothetical protein
MPASPADTEFTSLKGLETHVRHERISTTARWVKVSVGILLLLVLLFVVLHFTGTGLATHLHLSIIEHGGRQL